MPFSTGLSRAQIERLALLSEELGEAQQIIGKILRHGLYSCSPLDDKQTTNQTLLECEIGDVMHAIDRLVFEEDLCRGDIEERRQRKAETVRRYLHFQGGSRMERQAKLREVTPHA